MSIYYTCYVELHIYFMSCICSFSALTELLSLHMSYDDYNIIIPILQLLVPLFYIGTQ